MRPRDILAANVKALLKATGARFSEITEATGGKLTNGTLDRIRRAEVALTLDKLEDLAEFFNVQPWQLLVEGLNPEALPRLADQQFLKQLQEIVGGLGATNGGTEQSEAPAHQLQQKPGRDLSPALKQALDVKGIRRNESRKSQGVQKPRTRRRS